VITVCRQRVSLGRVHAGRTIRVHVAEHTLALELEGERIPHDAPHDNHLLRKIKGGRPMRGRSAGPANGTLGQGRPGEVMTETARRTTALRNLGRVSSLSRGKGVKHQVGLHIAPMPVACDAGAHGGPSG